MAKKKKKIATGEEDSMEKKETAFRVNFQVNERFRFICKLLRIDPKKQIEEMMQKWSDQNSKKVPKERIEELLVG